MLFRFDSLFGRKTQKSSRTKTREKSKRSLRVEALETRFMLTLPTGIETTPLFQLGYLDVTAYAGVNQTGAGDSTVGIQEAIDDAFDNKLATYFPLGTYTITDTLRVSTYQLWNTSTNTNNVPLSEPNLLVGEASNGNRPLLQLAANTPAFNTPSSPRPMAIFRNFRSISSAGVSKPALLPDPVAIPTGFEDGVTDLYNAEVRDLDFDLNENTGGVGLFMATAQSSSIENVRIDATGGYAGFWGVPGTNSGGATNIEVEGGQYGVLLDQPAKIANTVIAGARLYRQTDSAIYSTVAHPITLVGFDIIKDSGPALTTLQGFPFSTATGTLTLIDGQITIGDGSLAIENPEGRTFYMRNVYVTGTNNLVKSGVETTVTATGTWKQIEEYVYTDQTVPAGDPPYEVGDKEFRTFSVIDGVVSRSPEPATSIVSSSVAPPADLIARHVWDSLVSMKDGDTDGDGIGEFMNVLDYGATPDLNWNNPNDKGNDDRAAIQAAIDAASSAGHGRVFLPRGIYFIGDTLTLHANTKLFGAGRRISQIGVHDNWRPTMGEPAMIQTDDDAAATTFLGFMTLRKRTTGGASYGQISPYDRFNEVHWRAGRASMIAGLEIKSEFTPPNTTIHPQSIFKFTGNGGGRLYGVGENFRHDSHADYRVVKITGTTEPLAFYGLDTIASKGGISTDTNVEITDAANVRVYATQWEGDSPTAIITDSQNIAFYSGGKNTVEGGDNYQILGTSSDILIANIQTLRIARLPSQNTLRESLTGFSTVTVAMPEGISVYKRGEIDDSVMNFVPTGSGDFDADGDIDGSDFLAWQRGFGIESPDALPTDGDADGDQDVDGDDLAIWQSQFGSSAAPIAALPSSAEKLTADDLFELSFVANRTTLDEVVSLIVKDRLSIESAFDAAYAADDLALPRIVATNEDSAREIPEVTELAIDLWGADEAIRPMLVEDAASSGNGTREFLI